MNKYIAYYRVSTAKQGTSGLGLEAQQAQVLNFVNGKGSILKAFTEVESGKKDKRPQLEQAIATAKENGAILVIAKLDRLSRNVSFIFQLKDTGVDFVCADMPDANTLTIGIFATMAQYERELISQRTKAALGAKKAQGHKLGTPANLTPEARLQGLKTRQDNALNDKANAQARELAQLYKDKGMPLQAIADKLNKSGYVTRRGSKFVPTSVQRLLSQIANI